MQTMELDKLTLKSGGHDSREEGVCAMEAVAWIAGEPHSDHPQCCSLVIASFMRSWNDSLPTDADRDRLLKPLIPLLVGTATGEADDLTRSYMAMDWFVRVHAPAWMDLTPALAPHAAKLRGLPAIDNAGALVSAGEVLAAAWYAARAAVQDAVLDAAWYAAQDAARAAALDAVSYAAQDAAWYAASYAARDTAWDTAWDAARDAARDAAWAAARDAAQKKLATTMATLQESASELVRRMCAVGAEGGAS